VSTGNEFKVGGQPDSAQEDRKLGAQDKFCKYRSNLNLKQNNSMNHQIGLNKLGNSSYMFVFGRKNCNQNYQKTRKSHSLALGITACTRNFKAGSSLMPT
jgi:hypothetical protein